MCPGAPTAVATTGLRLPRRPSARDPSAAVLPAPDGVGAQGLCVAVVVDLWRAITPFPCPDTGVDATEIFGVLLEIGRQSLASTPRSTEKHAMRRRWTISFTVRSCAMPLGLKRNFRRGCRIAPAAYRSFRGRKRRNGWSRAKVLTGPPTSRIPSSAAPAHDLEGRRS
jgi:hypothetical protein